MLDRFLVLAESRGLPALIGINKVDLDDGEQGEAEGCARRVFADYELIYPVVYLSVRDGRGLTRLRDLLEGKVTVVAGPSGAGKSSLLNRLDPGRERLVGDISGATGKGRHTTTAAELFRIGPETFVADTPGIRALALHGVAPEDLDYCYPELRPYLGACFYADCTHIHEPGCAIQAAVDDGAVPRARYDSYVSLRRGDPDE
jgi:ribosome biogenesis GTPase